MHEMVRHIPFELKSLSDDGDFVGIASPYGNIDHGNDVVEPGAFDQSIKESGGKVRLMDSHKVRIGMATVRSTPQGLEATGKINKEKQSGAEAYSDLKFYKDNGMPLGMSIGYQTIDATPSYKSEDGARHLKKARLWEVTITEFPMNEKAVVMSVKSMQDLIRSIKARGVEQKDDFEGELEKIQLRAAVYQMESALSSALYSIRRDKNSADRVAASADTIAQYSTAYLAMLPDLLELDAEGHNMYYMSQDIEDFEQKAGRSLSKATREAIAKTIEKLQTLLTSADKPVEESKADAANAEEAETESEHDDHHSEDEQKAMQILTDMQALIPTTT